METLDLYYNIVVVNDRPYCVWDRDIKGTNIQFLESVDPSYYEYLADRHSAQLTDRKTKEDKDGRDDEDQHAALAIRAAFSQGLETLFAFLCAAIQAPYCVPAWMIIYRNKDLYNLVQRISNGEEVLSLLKERRVSWKMISYAVHEALELDDEDTETTIKSGFADLWSRFASGFLNEGFRNEYNSIKHGLRVRSGGFYLAFGAQNEPGKRAPKERMRLMGQSDFGSSFFDLEQIGDAKRHVRLRRNSRNWTPEDMVWGLHLISMSLANVVSGLKIVNGVSADRVQFYWPSDSETFKEPWKRTASMGVISMKGPTMPIPQELTEPFSKDEMLARYREGKVTGLQRFRLEDGAQDAE